MKNQTKMNSIYLTLCFLGISLSSIAQNKLLWQIGEADGSANEFALAPGKYQDFLKHDFGWEDRFYLIGHSSPKMDWPYVLPGPDDAWGGTSGTAGLRTHFLNILFRLENSNATDSYALIVDILNTSSVNAPLLKISVNGKSWTHELSKGIADSSLYKDTKQGLNHSIRMPLPGSILKNGANEINITSLEGSHLIFDDIRLEGKGSATVQAPNPRSYLRKVALADYEILQDNKRYQPLLIDIERLAGAPKLQVFVDDALLLEQTLESGRYTLEAPLPAVERATKSQYSIRLDGETIEQGSISRNKQREQTMAGYVDTRLGTAHSRWMIAPGPWMPFSLVKLSPDNQNAGWQAGYDPSFESIGTFSHIHEWTMGGLGIMPVNGELITKIGDQSALKKDKGYRSAIAKDSEEAGLGYYKVKLSDYDILAELTATNRCGFQRYTYPKGQDGRVMIDLMIPSEYHYEILESEIRQVGDRRIEGFSKQQTKNVWSDDASQDYIVHFVIEFDQPIKKFGGWVNEDIIDSKVIRAANPKGTGVFVEFDTKRQQSVQVRSAISYVDIEGARKNLTEEVISPFGWDFDAVRSANVVAWDELFGRIAITSNDAREKKRFYTNMYRAFCRNTFEDVDGRWVDATEKIQQLQDKDAAALGCDAFWNTFWNLNQLWNLAAPEWTSKWVKSQLAMYDANGWLAKGPAGMEYIPVMVAEHEIPLLVSAYQMGIRDYDVDKMYEAIIKMQTTPAQSVGDGFAGNRDIETYLQHQFVPADKGRFSNTLEYSFDDWTVAQLAKALHKTEDYKIFSERGSWWKNAINPETGYAQLRYSNGEWEKAFDPFKSGANHHYVEGNAWQLTYFVPQDVPALADRIGVDKFITRLTWGFEASEPWRYNAPGDQYWDFPVVQGNQQSMHFSFLFNWVGQPWQTQRWSRSIIDKYYGFEVDNAYLGDEDQGQMSAWFVMAALGLFQTDGGCSIDPVYEIGSPLFEEVKINLGGAYGRGEQFTIKANNASRLNKYIQSARLNGKPLNSFKFSASDLLKGGSLELEMVSQPNLLWGVIE